MTDAQIDEMNAKVVNVVQVHDKRVIVRSYLEKPELSERVKLLAMLKELVSLYPDDGYDPIPIVRKARACITEVEKRQK